MKNYLIGLGVILFLSLAMIFGMHLEIRKQRKVLLETERDLFASQNKSSALESKLSHNDSYVIDKMSFWQPMGIGGIAHKVHYVYYRKDIDKGKWMIFGEKVTKEEIENIDIGEEYE